MPARQQFNQENERRAALTAVLTRAIRELAVAPPGLIAPAATETPGVQDLRVILAVLQRANRVRPLDPDLTQAATALAAALPAAEAEAHRGPLWPPPVDVLHVDRTVLVAFTRALASTTRAGAHLPRLPRPVPQLLDDAEAALGVALIAGDHEVSARLLATWPLLGSPWTAPARCAIDHLLSTALLGELPADADTASAVALLCALALEHDCVPEPWSATETDCRVGERLGAGEPVRDAALVVAAALRDAAESGDRSRQRAILAIAVSCGVGADASIAATLQELCGLSAFAALAG